MTNRPPIPLLLLLPLLLIGCKSTPPPAPAATADTTPAVTYSPRPTTPPAPFKLFHHGNNSFTLVVKDTATDDEITSLVWQLHDAARAHAFDKLHIPQKQVDAYGPSISTAAPNARPKNTLPASHPAEAATTPPATTPWTRTPTHRGKTACSSTARTTARTSGTPTAPPLLRATNL